MRFRYLRDPLFLLCAGAYLVNRFILKPACEGGFVHEHLNDLLCVPLWLPVMLLAQRRLGLRDGDDGPRPGEVVVALVVWSWAFELALPAVPGLGGRFVADPWDVLYYALGALAASGFWTWWYGGADTTTRPRTS